MGSTKSGNRKKQQTDWGKETRHSFAIIGKVTGKVFSYILNALMTILLIALITGTIVGIVFVVYINNYIKVDMSGFVDLTTEQSMTTRIYYMDYTDRENRIGTPVEIEDQQLFSSENRTWVSYSEIPENLINAFISIEDERFREHNGVDWKRTVGATLHYVTGTDNYGGSTITQQLIKNITGDDDVTIQRKMKEIFSAIELEKLVTKDEILELYLNTIFLSEHCYGIQAASQAYFGKNVSDLSLVECASLAAIPKFPTKYDPYINPENNFKRRRDVLFKMHELGYIADDEYEKALDEELVINDKIEVATKSATTSWYTDAVIEDAIDLLVENGVPESIAAKKIYTGGYKIWTVMDPYVQNILDDYFKNDDNFKRINNGVQPEASMVVLDPATGDILGIAGGRGEKTSSRVLNFATQTTRSPGSSIKPVSVYGPALEYGVITYSSVIIDSPVKNGWPVNYPAGYRGPTTIHDGVARSVNTVAVKVLQKLGVENSYDFAHNKLGMHSIIDSLILKNGTEITDLNLSALGLGGMNYGVTVRELASAYQVFANKGVYTGNRTIIKILDSQDNVIIDNSGTSSIVMSEQNAGIMTMILEGVVDHGTASRMKLKNKIDVAGKTGTTSSDNDRWFMGFNPYYIGGVWFGYEMPMSLNGFSEVDPPAMVIWDNVMTQLLQREFDKAANGEAKLAKFERPSGIITRRVCKYSGLLMTPACEGSGEIGYFTSSSVPTKYCTYHNGEGGETDPNAVSSDTTTASTDTTKAADTTKAPVTQAPQTSETTAAKTDPVIDDPTPTETETDTPEPPTPPDTSDKPSETSEIVLD